MNLMNVLRGSEVLNGEFEGIQYSLDAKNRKICVTLAEQVDAVEALKKLPVQVPPLTLSEESRQTLDQVAGEMNRTGKRHLEASFALRLFTVKITGTRVY